MAIFNRYVNVYQRVCHTVELSYLLSITPAWQEFVFSYWELLATCNRCFFLMILYDFNMVWFEQHSRSLLQFGTAEINWGHCFVACCLSEMRYLYFPFWGCVWSWTQTISGVAAASEAKHRWAHFYCRNVDRGQDTCIYQPGWWFGTFYIFPYIGNFIIPTDELIFFRGVGQPPTSNST